MVSRLSERWRELHGSKDWDGLTAPLDMDFRKELIRYGDFIQVTNDAFPGLTNSRYAGGCFFGKPELFSKTGLHNTGYTVTRYLYAYVQNVNLPGFAVKPDASKASAMKQANWIGYVAVTTDEEEIKRLGRRDIVIAWRGTRTSMEWAAVLRANQIPITSINGKPPAAGVMVHEGFWRMLSDNDPANAVFNKDSCAKQLTQEVKRLVEEYQGEQLSITVVGHSLGASMATLAAYQIAEDGVNKTSTGDSIPLCVYSFASPRCANVEFGKRFNSLGVKCLQIEIIQDIIPDTPLGDGVLADLDVLNQLSVSKWSPDSHPKLSWDERISMKLLKLTGLGKVAANLGLGYSHVGVKFKLDYTKSPYLKQSLRDNFGNSHNLQVHLHLIAGVVGVGEDLEKPFNTELFVDRDLAVINKNRDILKAEYAQTVPPIWWQLGNKGLVQDDRGRWVEKFRYDVSKDIPENALYD